MDFYQRYEALSPIYSGGLTNHLPMVYTALKQLGLKEEEIIVKLDEYKDTKAIFDLTDSATPVGEFEQEYINRTSFYLGQINNTGIDIVIGNFINNHKLEIASALFHGLIRLAYAKEEKSNIMVAQALSYFELSCETIDVSATSIDKDDFGENYQLLLETIKTKGFEFTSTRSMDKLRELLDIDVVKQGIRELRNPTKEFVLDFILKQYLKTNDFYVLHLITGFDALLEMEEYLYDFDELLNQFFVYSQVFVLFNLDEKEEEHNSPESFSDLTEKARSLVDFHDIKLFYSLKKLDRLFENELIKTVANTLFIK